MKQLQQLQREQLMLQQKQAELQKKLLSLQAEKPAANPPPPTPASIARPDASDAGSSDQEEPAGDDDWDLGPVVCPKTGKAAFTAYKDVSQRKELGRLLVDSGFNEKKFAIATQKIVTKEKEKSLTVDAGWYTEQEMKDKLGYDVKTIKKIVDYTSKNPALLQRPL
ncbi:unnamed protein product [Symbiodinium sp. CCMP2456]|nr:unnamed protein product [Symbiodinium sp. CCMP2456]